MGPWEIRDGKLPELASLLRNVQKFKTDILEIDPWLPFPQNSCCFSFGDKGRPLPIGALFLLWEKWPNSTGLCPLCQEPVFGYGFGGLLNIGGVTGCCSHCGQSLFRNVGGLAHIGHEINPILKSTPFFIKQGLFGGTFEGLRVPLAYVLRELGAEDLPDEEWTSRHDPSAVDLKSNP